MSFQIKVTKVDPGTRLVTISTGEVVTIGELKRRADVPNPVVRSAYEEAVSEAKAAMRRAERDEEPPTKKEGK